MIYIHKSQNIDIVWRIFRGTSLNKENFNRVNTLAAFLTDVGTGLRYHVPCSVSDSHITMSFPASGLPAGVYDLGAVWVKNRHSFPERPDLDGRCVVRTRRDNVFAVTEHGEEATRQHKDRVLLQVETTVATYGYDGLDAYELQVLRGEWNGSEQEWLDQWEKRFDEWEGRVREKLDEMERKFSEWEGRIGGILEDFGSRIEEVERQMQTMTECCREVKGRLDGLDGRLDGLDGRLDGLGREIEELRKRIEDMEKAGAERIMTYSEISVTLTYDDIPAGGGTASPHLSYSQTWGYDGATAGGGTVTTGAVVSYEGEGVNGYSGNVTAAGRGDEEGERRKVATSTVTVRMNGKTGTASADVYQAANGSEVTYGEWGEVSIEADSSPIPRGGGEKALKAVQTRTKTVSYASGRPVVETENNREFVWKKSSDASGAFSLEDTGGEDATVRAGENGSARSRYAVIMATGKDGKWASEGVTQETGDATLSVDPDRLEFAAAGESRTFRITSNTAWTITLAGTTLPPTSGKSGWFTVSPSSGSGNATVTVTAGKNSGAVRKSVLTVRTETGQQATVSLTQKAGHMPLSVSPDALEFVAAGESRTFQITSNEPWTVTETPTITPTTGTTPTPATGGTPTPTPTPVTTGWFSVSPSSGSGNATVTVKAGKNSGAVRKSALTVRTETGQQATVSLKQAAAMLYVSPDRLSFAAAGESKTIRIETGEKWTIALEDAAGGGTPTTSTLASIPPTGGTTTPTPTGDTAGAFAVDKTSGSGSATVNVKALENATESVRTGLLRVTTESGQYATVSLMQERNATVTHYPLKVVRTVKEVDHRLYGSVQIYGFDPVEFTDDYTFDNGVTIYARPEVSLSSPLTVDIKYLYFTVHDKLYNDPEKEDKSVLDISVYGMDRFHALHTWQAAGLRYDGLTRRFYFTETQFTSMDPTTTTKINLVSEIHFVLRNKQDGGGSGTTDPTGSTGGSGTTSPTGSTGTTYGRLDRLTNIIRNT